MAAVEYASSKSALVIQSFFAAAQLQHVYCGEQRDGNALISAREWTTCPEGAWRWVYATRAIEPAKGQLALWKVLQSIEDSIGVVGAANIRASAQEIAGCICALVRILPGSTRLLADTGIYIVPEAHFYHFTEIHCLPTPIRVEYLRNPDGSTKWATRYLSFGCHVDIKVVDSLKAAAHCYACSMYLMAEVRKW